MVILFILVFLDFSFVLTSYNPLRQLVDVTSTIRPNQLIVPLKYYQNKYSAGLMLGPGMKNFTFTLDFQNDFTWVASEKCLNCMSTNKYYPSDATMQNALTMSNTQTYRSGIITGDFTNETLFLTKEYFFKNYSIFLLNNTSNVTIGDDASLSLSLTTRFNNKYTLIQQLFLNKTINNQKLYLSTFKQDPKLILGAPEQSNVYSTIKNALNYCQSKISLWSCVLMQITSSNESVSFQQFQQQERNVLLNADNNLIEIPTNDFESFKGIYFDKPSSNSKNCSFKVDEKVKCKCGGKADFKPFSLLLGSNKGLNITILPENVINYNPNNEFQCEFNVLKSKTDNWKFGIQSINNALFEFDFENKNIGFYSINETFVPIFTNFTNELIQIGDSTVTDGGFFSSLFSLILYIGIGLIAILVLLIFFGIAKGAYNYVKNKNNPELKVFTTAKLNPRSFDQYNTGTYSGDLVGKHLTMIEMEHKS